MDRCALFVDAGYLLADGAMAAHGTRRREAVSWDYTGLLQLLTNLSRERTGLPLLRCYWYEATVEGRHTPEHDALADIPGLKLRLSRIRPGRREGVDAQVHRDLMTLARNNAICDAVVVSGDEDLAQVVCDAQDLGIRITVVHIAADGGWAVSRSLRQECDDLIEIGGGHLRPYAGLTTGTTELPALSNGAASGNGAVQGGVPVPLGNGLPPGGTGSYAVSGGSSSGAHATSSGSLPTGGYAAQSGSPASGGQAASGNGAAQGGSTTSGGGASAGGSASQPQPSRAGQSQPALPVYASYAQESPSTSPAQALPPSSPAPSSSSVAPNGPTGATPQYASGGTGGMPSYQPVGSYTGPQSVGGYTGPQAAPVPVQGAATGGATTLSDAVKAAHKEGHDFGESVAKDAPALWLEAVLARKPRMPSDLEARLLQGSSLPIDFLLHDEVRHALRRGFWDALEQARH
ncbi:NYN domain-containing protein [Planomonospora sp. ID67723]|uniref:NYN domain-containing protein n=1 Tax=Planomonospora sp. ID67723 TaxID=2738134 RepID=UPI0018C42353|nr:NYN domain-containing protein [Planomonospora sp. ID67723]MBG0827207.1 NYN domain-containing protein [Planomonospora sp. ID67723]